MEQLREEAISFFRRAAEIQDDAQTGWTIQLLLGLIACLAFYTVWRQKRADKYLQDERDAWRAEMREMRNDLRTEISLVRTDVLNEARSTYPRLDRLEETAQKHAERLAHLEGKSGI